MLFNDLLNQRYRELRPSFEKLYDLILEKQTHESDLLLIYLNGFYYPEVHAWEHFGEKLSPYTFGLNHDGHSERTHHAFIGQYIKNNTSDRTLPDYLKDITHDESRTKEIEQKKFEATISMQTEMLIYLKIWESDTFIKKFYQLANLSQGRAYDWHYKLKSTSREEGATGTRDVLIRKMIRDKFKDTIPRLYEAFKNTYNFQIRNSIAHSQYSILDTHIQLNNYIKTDPYAQLKVQTFEDWTDRFHETIVLYTLYHELLSTINNNYGMVASEMGDCLPIRISRRDPVEEFEYRLVYYRDVFKSWGTEPD